MLGGEGSDDRRAERGNARLTGQRTNRARPGSGASQGTVLRVADAFTGGFQVALALDLTASSVIHQRIEAGQTGACGEEYCQEQEGACGTAGKHDGKIVGRAVRRSGGQVVRSLRSLNEAYKP